MSTDDRYKVEITSVAQKKYIKKLTKRHKSCWAITMIALQGVIERIEALLRTDRAEILHTTEGHRLIKVYFTIARSGQSAKASGHRCIAHIENKRRVAHILLVYSKHEISPPNETEKIRTQIKIGHPHLAELFNLK